MNSFSKPGSQRPPSSSSPSISFDSYKFDFGISSSNTSSSTRPLKDQHKLNPNSSSSSSNPSSSSPAPKPSWTHQPTPPARSALPNPSPSMIGDIHGRSWSHSSSHIGIPDKNPNLFGDLLGSAIGLGRAPQNVPLKSTPINKAGPAIGSVTKPSVGSSSNSINPDPFESLSGFGSKPSLSSVNGTGIGSFATFQKPIKIPNTSPPPQPQRPVSGSGADSLDMFFSNSSSSAAPAPIPEMNDWDVGAEFGGDENGGTTIELEGLPPPPAGVTAASAKTKGLDNYKQGQFADAIKWLSWAFVLFEKSGQVASSNEVLVCRSSCYKEVGEYKKAIADCSKVLDHDRTNVSVLLQRALLYESSEKYKLGAEDLRAVLKIDPGNRLARSTIHRMNQFAE